MSSRAPAAVRRGGAPSGLPFRRLLAGIMLATLSGAPPARGDFPQARLAALHPPGGQRGTTVEVRLVGTDLDDLERIEFFHPGIVAAPVVPEPSEFDPEPRPLPGRMRVQIAASVPPGAYDAVAVGRFGVSNPRVFMVGAAPEVVKTRNVGTPATALDVPNDATISGAAEPNVADHYAVQLAAGQRIHLEVWARRIESRLTAALAILDPDGRVVAKPRGLHGEDPWLEFVATKPGRHVIRIHDTYLGGGDEMPYRLTISTGPIVEAVFPPAAVPGGTVKLTAIGRGLPGATPAAVTGAADGLGQVAVDAQLGDVAAGASGRIAWRMLAPQDTDAPVVDAFGGVLDTMPVPPAVLASERPVVVEQEPNDDAGRSQRIEPPVAVAGRFHPVGDRDWLSFDAKAGDTFVLELYSRRLGLATDSSLLVQRVTTGTDGKAAAEDVAFADDGPAEFSDPLADRPGLDPLVTFKPPADGTYRVLVRELAADSRAGVDKAWVLDVRRPDPGFHLVAMLAQRDQADKNRFTRIAPSLPAGGSLSLEVLALRRDGFAGEIALEAEGLPEGVTAHGGVIPAGANRGSLVLTAAEHARPVAGGFRVVGRGRTGDDSMSEVASVASLCWNVDNQNMPLVLREAREIPIAVTADVAPVTVTPAESKPWEVVRGAAVTIPLAVARRAGAKGGMTLSAAGLPAELKLAELKLDEKATAAALAVSAGAKLPAGTYPILLRGIAKTSYARNPDAAKRARADVERIAALAKDRAAKSEAAGQAVGAAEKAVAAAKAAGQTDVAALEQAVVKAKEARAAAETAAKAAEAERAKRAEAAKAAETASAAKDIDVPLAVPPILVVVKDPPPEPPKP